MNLLQMKYYVETVQSGAISKAAVRLGITQAALSMALTKLEEEIGFPLIYHEKKQLRLTDYGRIVLKYCWRILHEIDDIYVEFDELKGNYNQHTIHICLNDADYYFDWLINFQQATTDTYMHMQYMPFKEIEAAIHEGSVDFGIVWLPRKPKELASNLLLSQPFELLVLADHPLAQAPIIEPSNLEKEPIIALPSSYIERSINFLGKRLDFSPNIIFEGNPEIMFEMFHAGIGHIITCQHNRKHWMHGPEKQYRAIEIQGGARYEVYLVWSKNRYLNKTARQFKDYVLDYYHIL